MRIFICAGEPSGDLHGANLVRTLRRLRPDVECVGFGGERMEAAGCRLLYPLCRLAVMWFTGSPGLRFGPRSATMKIHYVEAQR